MPVQIGGSVHDFLDPTGFLSDCHRRIEMFLGSLEAVAEVVNRPLTEESRRGLEAALLYFGGSAPKHNADEEESLFPRMRGIGHPDIQFALAKLDKLEKEHRWAAPLHAAVERLGTIFLSGKSLSAGEVEEFRRAVSALGSMYREHIRVEEDVVFPAAARLLSREEQAAIGKEMAARRNVKVPGL